MKKTIKMMVLLLFAAAISAGMISCDSAYHKETDKMIAQCEQSISRDNLNKCESDIKIIKNRELTQKQAETVWQIESKINELKEQIFEQNRIAAQKKYKHSQNNSSKTYPSGSNNYNSNSIDSKFIGRYTILGGDWDCPIEVLSDGRILLISRVIVTGEETKKCIGDINIISGNAFTIKNTSYNVSLCYNGTPIYVIRNGVERNTGWTSRDGLTASSLVFDIAENRAYRGVQEYRNRDIGEVEYVKFKR